MQWIHFFRVHASLHLDCSLVLNIFLYMNIDMCIFEIGTLFLVAIPMGA